jgi:hypothetical protein
MTSVMINGSEIRDCSVELVERNDDTPALQIHARGLGPVLIVLSEGDAHALLSTLYLALERQAMKEKK